MLGVHIVQMNLTLCKGLCLPSYFLNYVSTFPIHVSWESDLSFHIKMVTVVSFSCKEHVSLTVQLQFLYRWLLIPVSIIAVVPTILEKSVFYEYLSLYTFFVTTRAFVPQV